MHSAVGGVGNEAIRQKGAKDEYKRLKITEKAAEKHDYAVKNNADTVRKLNERRKTSANEGT